MPVCTHMHTGVSMHMHTLCIPAPVAVLDIVPHDARMLDAELSVQGGGCGEGTFVLCADPFSFYFYLAAAA